MEKAASEEESLIAKATGQEALKHAITAADLYLKAAQKAPSQAERVRLRRKADELITQAEFLKAGSPIHTLVVRSRPIPTKELTILWRSSRLRGNSFPPWDSDPADDAFALRPGQEPFIDRTEYSLSRLQNENILGWERPTDIFWPGKKPPSADVLMQSGTEHDLVQDVTSDCSVVASLCSAMDLMRPGKDSILKGLVFPFDESKGCPAVSANGRYIFKMNFNGCFRRVEIDDRLPSSKTDRTLFVVDLRNPFLIWPALMEKAYLKVRGGYDFPGSNSCTDLWVLTGWIPEQLFFQRDEIDLEMTWGSISQAFESGNVIVTLGTGRISDSEEQATGLVGEHDYGVLRLESTAGIRRLLIKNPWWTSARWRNMASSDPPRISSEESPQSPDAVRPAGSVIPQPEGTDMGTFWMSLEDVSQKFESMYLNWDPTFFRYRLDHHFTWDVRHKRNMSAAIIHNPQFSVVSRCGGEVWILLARHFADGEVEISKGVSSSGGKIAGKLGFMSLAIFENSGSRVQKRTMGVYNGPYVDSPQTLAKLRAVDGTAYTVVPLQDKLPMPSYSFTLSFFSHQTLDTAAAESSMSHYTEIQGAWTRRSAGGNTGSPKYGCNPQFSITVPTATPLSLLLCTDSTDVAIHIDLVWAHGERVGSSLAAKDVLADSKEYVKGCAELEIPLVDAGTYTAVCSTFEEGQLADFTLRIGSQVQNLVRPVPADGAGRMRTRLGPFVFSEGEERRRASIAVRRLTRACATVRSSLPSSPDLGQRHSTVALRLLLVHGLGPGETTLAASGDGEFREPTVGLRTLDFDIEPERLYREGLWVVVERVGGYGSREGIEVELLSDGPISVGPWEIVG